VPLVVAVVIAIALLLEMGLERRRRGAASVETGSGPVASAQPRTFVVPHAMLQKLEPDKLQHAGRR
jgi:hypothetical protein